MAKTEKDDFYSIIEVYLNHPKVLEMMKYPHHGTNRYYHSLRVAKYTYIITKALHLNYKSATKSAMLHDFYLDEVEKLNGNEKLKKHPTYASQNAEKYFGLTKKEKDMIEKHMFPVTKIPPKYIESWILDIVDDAVAIYERANAIRIDIKSYAHVIIVLIMTLLK